MSFFTELRRRNVTRVAIGYLAIAWLLLQVGDVMFPALNVPDWSLRLLIGLLSLGFPVALVLAWAFNITPHGIERDGIEREDAALPSAATHRNTHRRFDLIIIGVLVAALVFMVIDNYVMDDATPAHDFARGEVDALAVLPLQLLNHDVNEEYLAEGMTSSLINELSKIESLNVISRTSVQQYKNSDIPLTEIAAALGVDAIIEGTVMRIGDQVRISTSLVPAQSNTSVWSETYDRDLGDILAMHSEIARAVADQIRLELSEEDVQRLVAPAAATAEVQHLILEGEYEIRESHGKQGLELLEAATQSAPDYAPAWVALAKAYKSFSYNNPNYIELARDAALKALALDQNLSDAHMVVGSIAFYQDWAWDRAFKSLNRSLELNPGNEQALQILGDYYEILGEYDKSIELGIDSVKAAPNSASMRVNLGLTYNYSGQFQKGLESCDTGEAPEDVRVWNAVCIADAYIGLKDMDNAVRYATAALAKEGIDHMAQALMAGVLGAAGYTDRAEEIRVRFETLAKSEYVSPTTLAFVSFAAGDVDGFFSYLETAIREKAIYTPWFASVPAFASVRDDPRFAALVAKLNLP